MIEKYLPILLLIGIALFLALLLMGVSRLLGPYRPNKVKLKPYESGMDPVGDADDRYSINYYLVAMAFIVFDIEIVFIYPWAIQYVDAGLASLISMMIFIAELVVGLVYLLKKGTLDWNILDHKPTSISDSMEKQEDPAFKEN